MAISIHKTPYKGSYAVYPNEWKEEEATFKDVQALITKFVWSPCVWKDGVRKKDNFQAASLCVLDFDEGLSLKDAIKKFSSYKHIIGTTKSHGIKGDRFRVVLEFARCITNVATYEFNQASLIGQVKSDPATKDGGRLFAPCVAIVSQNNEGKLIPVQTPPEPRVYEKSDVKYKTKAMRELETFGLFGQGQRNSKLLKIAVSMAIMGHTEKEILEFFIGRTDLDEGEVRRIATNGHKIGSVKKESGR